MKNKENKLCPKCGSENEYSSQECIKCGVIFEKREKKGKEQLKAAHNAFNNNQLLEAKNLFLKLSTDYPELVDQIAPYVDKIDQELKSGVNSDESQNNTQEKKDTVADIDDSKMQKTEILSGIENIRHYIEEPSVSILRLIAWLNLIGGILVAILIFQNNYPDSIALIWGVSSLAVGIIGSVLLLVICSIANNLTEIREKINLIVAFRNDDK